MFYFVTVSYDLANASSQDYADAYEDLANLGLYHVISGEAGNPVPLPNTTVSGSFCGASAAMVRNDVSDRVQRAFRARGFRSKILVTVGADWAWAQRLT